MKGILRRLWTGIVAAVAGAALALVVVIVLIQAGKKADILEPTVEILSGIGFVLGVVFGGKKTG
jgi:hypothetical protein